MRDTLDLDDDLLNAAKSLARRQGAQLFAPKDGAPKPDLRLVNQLREEA